MKDNHEEYLTVAELSKRIKFSKQTIYNMISARKLVKGQHYVKPSKKKVLFTWSNMLAWLEDQNDVTDEQGEDSGGAGSTGNRIHI
jgi:hypothetical protein